MRSLFIFAVLTATSVLVVTHSEFCYDALAQVTSPAVAHELAIICHDHILTATLALTVCAFGGIFFGAHHANTCLAERQRHAKSEEEIRAEYDKLFDDYMVMVGRYSDLSTGIPRPDVTSELPLRTRLASPSLTTGTSSNTSGTAGTSSRPSPPRNRNLGLAG